MRRERNWAGPTGRYGAAGESGAWRVAYQHYYWDRLKEAYIAASELGAGEQAHGLVGFRMIEGEWTTRERGTITKVNDWLSVEAIAEELPPSRGGSSGEYPLPNPPPRGREPDARPPEGLPAGLVERITNACDQVAARFGFQHGTPVLFSVLAEESDVPWMPGRHGYCIDKHPYDKICAPNYSLHDPDDLEHLVLHEYSHVVSLNLSQGQCPHWLDEAMAMVSGGGVDRRAWRLLESGRAEWRDPVSLDLAFLRNREDEGTRQDVWLAYQQSAVIGFYLAGLKGEKALGDLMRAFADNSFLHDVWLRVRGTTPVDAALRDVYGFGAERLFERAREWLGRHGSGV